MSSEPTAVIEPAAIAAPPPRQREIQTGGGRRWGLVALTVVVAIGLTVWASGLLTRQTQAQPTLFPTILVERGDISIDILESGSLESTNNATVRCQVEALIGTVGGQATSKGGSRGSSGGGTTAKASSGGVAAAAGFGAAKGKLATTGLAATTTKAATGAGNPAATSSSSAASSAVPGAATVLRAPTITSFSYKVTPHVPLRPKSTLTNSKSKAANPQQGMGGGGGFGGMTEQQGSTRILTILPEGTLVKAGELVCTLDSAAFVDEQMAQRIRFDQAKTWVDQATALLEVNEISLSQYRLGTLPMDRDLIEGYIQTTNLELKRATTTLEWSREAQEKGFRTAAQLKGDELALDRAKVQSQEAQTMKRRLEEFAAPRLIRNLEAKSAAIRADLLAQEQALKLEENRLKRLETIIENCKMFAPRDGLVVYANTTNGWGRAEAQIREGVTVRERQPIFNLPDPNKMSVRVRINEAKVNSIYKGQKTKILIDAFPEQPLNGTVREVTVIPAPANGPFSDVKIYGALVDIDSGGFDDLRPGLSAQVSFHVADLEDVLQVPVGSLRWFNGRPWVARVRNSGDLEWIVVGLGKVGTEAAEIVSGLEQGDRLARDPSSLPPPPSTSRPSANGEGADADD